ncbi:MAG: hypothetical protein ACRYF1_22480 [Janthinobacterium lividum]
MSHFLSANFETRREAEMTVERLVQEFGLDRAAIIIAAAGDQNSVGNEQAGSDVKAGDPSPEHRADAPLRGAIIVAVDVHDHVTERKIREAFAEFDATDVAEKV